jgi:hypothetical protein
MTHNSKYAKGVNQGTAKKEVDSKRGGQDQVPLTLRERQSVARTGLPRFGGQSDTWREVLDEERWSTCRGQDPRTRQSFGCRLSAW